MTIDQFPMLDALHSDGPAQDRSEKMMLYGQFIGSWEGDIVVHLSGGEQYRGSCEIHFGWALEGLAIQDIWISPARKDRQNISASVPFNMYGTTLRVYDPQSDLWTITWCNPVSQTFSKMTGQQIGDDIVQEYTAEDGTRVEWRFTEITENSFHWIRRESKDGASWEMKIEYFVQRKTIGMQT
jgi:hypothetical protein